MTLPHPPHLVRRAAVATAREAARHLRLLRLLADGGRLPAAGVAVTHVVSAVLPAATALAAGQVIAALAAGAHRRQVYLGVALVIGLALVSQVLSAVQDLLRLVLAGGIDGRVRQRVRRVAYAPVGVAHLETSEFHDDAARACDLGHGIGRARSPGTAAVGQVVLLFRYVSAFSGAALLALFFPVLAVALLLASLLVRARLRRQWVRLVSVKDTDAAGQRRLAYLGDLAVHAAAKEIRVYGLADWLLGRRRALAYQVHGPTWRQLWRVLRRQKLVLCLSAGSVAAAFAVPGFAAMDGRIGPGQLVTAVGAAFTILAICAVGDETFEIEYGMGAVRAVDRLSARFAVSDRSAERSTVEPSATGPPPLVQFEDVRFGYPTGPLVLDGLSLALRPAETVALVGHNGAGKTTLIKLLAGMYPPTGGRITVDGRDLAGLDLRRWRRNLAVVFQDFLRYPDTVAGNVALSAPERAHDRAGIVDALRLAGLADLVTSLPDGLDTSLWREGTAGTELSGGQWQRVALARALFAVAHGRRILLLDEPTAHLDVSAEAAFHRQVVSAVRGTTVVLISHRFSTVRSADRIVLLRNGRVAEQGGHDELMSLGGEYRRLFTLQASRFTADRRPPQPVGEP